MVDKTSDQASREQVSALQQKCSAANFAPPDNPTAIVALESSRLEHREASLRSVAEVVSLIAQLNVAKARLKASASGWMDLSQVRAKLIVVVASKAQAQASKAETMGRLVGAETRLVTFDRDLERRGTRCTLLTNEAASIRVDVQRLYRQLGSAILTVVGLQGSFPRLLRK